MQSFPVVKMTKKFNLFEFCDITLYLEPGFKSNENVVLVTFRTFGRETKGTKATVVINRMLSSDKGQT